MTERKWIKKRLLYCILLMPLVSYSQTVQVKEVGQEPSTFVNQLLDNACVEISNARISSSESVALFTDSGGKFPISEGVLIRSGEAKLTEGRYTGEHLSSQINTNGDRDLERINSKSGQSPEITDVAFLEFEFVPLSSNFNFNFLFASNEYGEWQCVSSDVFAFLLTDLTTGETQNLAVVPGTDIPVSVRNIKDKTYNASCQSDFPELFGRYQVDDPDSVINMRGYTQLMNASADIEPGRPYRIRLVIGDSNDGKYDSAIFLEAGSFNANVDLGEDKQFCNADVHTIETGLDSNLYSHTWTRNGVVIPDASGNRLEIQQTGTYGVRVTQKSNKCLVTDEVIFSDLQVKPPKDLKVCHAESQTYYYDLTTNDALTLGLDPKKYEVMYFPSFTRMRMNQPIPQAQVKRYKSSGNQEIFVKVIDLQSGSSCTAESSFLLEVNAPVSAYTPDPIQSCFSPGKALGIDLTQARPQILGDQDPDQYQVSFFSSREDAEQNVRRISTPESYKGAKKNTTQTVWARVHDSAMTECYSVVPLQLILSDPPPVDKLEDVVECSFYVLPEIQNGQYFTGSGGSGTALFAGDIITESGRYYIFNGPNSAGCTNESSFQVTIIEKYSVSGRYCGSFTVPTPPEGSFYTRPGGPEGAGLPIPSGTILSTSQQIFFYAEVDGTFCRDDVFDIEILPLPAVDQPDDVITCGQYVLPALDNGKYYTLPQGKGRQLSAGTTLDSSMDLFVFNTNGTCTNEHSFRINITPQFEDVVSCGPFELPEVEVGSFYTQAAGKGTQLPPGSSVTSSQRVYFFAETASETNCTETTSFHVEVIPLPPVSDLPDVLLCEGEIFVLPEISDGSYFAEEGRNGKQFSPGDQVKTTTTFFINNLENGCSNETSFTVEIRSLPEVENFTDIYSCGPYTLPALEHGKYYTQAGAKGEELKPGEVISNTRSLYVYSYWEDLKGCTNETAFTIYVEGVDVGDFADITACDAYQLPALSVGNYYTEPMGRGKQLKAGQRIQSSQRIYVYASQGKRFICEDQASFEVSISKTPALPVFKDVEACGSYALPQLSQQDYKVDYYWESDGIRKISSQERILSEPGTYTIHVFATAQDNSTCISQKSFSVEIFPLLDLEIQEGVLCKDPSTGEIVSEAYLSSGLDPEEFEVDWFFENQWVHTGPDLFTDQAGTFEVVTRKLKPETGASCNYKPTTVQVIESGVPVISAKVTAPFEEVAVVTVRVEKGYGSYQFSLNQGPFQQSNEFYDVPSGVHRVSVKGLYGDCGVAELEVVVLKFPQFFTPNQDGYNDSWTIPDLADHPEAQITVFDRYGKLLKTFPVQESWDGTFNGRKMPSDDYWFRVSFDQDGVPKQFKSHFTLIR